MKSIYSEIILIFSIKIHYISLLLKIHLIGKRYKEKGVYQSYMKNVIHVALMITYVFFGKIYTFFQYKTIIGPKLT